MYLAVIMDVLTRSIRGRHLGCSLDQSLTLIALNRALTGPTPEIHHSDQGIQYAATAYIQMHRAVDAETSMAEIGEAWQNSYASGSFALSKRRKLTRRITSAIMMLSSNWAGS